MSQIQQKRTVNKTVNKLIIISSLLILSMGLSLHMADLLSATPPTASPLAISGESANYKITTDIISSGGESGSSANYGLFDTFGEPFECGESSSNNFSVTTCSLPALFGEDDTAPTGSIVINNDDTYTNDPDVTLTLTAVDDTAVTEMNLTYNGSSHDWIPYSITSSVALTEPDGVKSVSVQYRDLAENESSIYSDTIILDAVEPTSTIDILPTFINSTSFNVSWSGYDATSGINCYQIQVRDDSGDWANWFPCTSETSAQFESAEAGHTYCFRSRAVDNAGNLEPYPSTPDYDTCTQVEKAFVFLPAILNNYPYCYPGPWEVEPNNDEANANGSLCSNQDYFGIPNDNFDYFYFISQAEGPITITLEGIQGYGPQLLLRPQTSWPSNCNDEDLSDWQPPYEIVCNDTQPGLYHAIVYVKSDFNNETYTLRVTYPDTP